MFKEKDEHLNNSNRDNKHVRYEHPEVPIDLKPVESDTVVTDSIIEEPALHPVPMKPVVLNDKSKPSPYDYA